MSAPQCGLTESERRYNDLTTQLDRAIRHLNTASAYTTRGRDHAARDFRIEAARILEDIGPELLVIDPEVA